MAFSPLIKARKASLDKKVNVCDGRPLRLPWGELLRAQPL
jgi:hypothetical protein